MKNNKLSEYIFNDIDKFRFNRFIYFLILIYPALLILISYYFLILNYSASYHVIITKENYPVEFLTNIFLTLGVCLGIYLIYKMYERKISVFKILFTIFITLFLLFVALEEISWGQWLFKFKSPEYFKLHNLQRETNIHNISGLHVIFEYIRALIGVGGIISIILNRFKAFYYISSPFVLITSFVVVTFFSSLDIYNYYNQLYAIYMKGSFWWFIKFNMEIIELIISISAFIFLLSNIRRLKSN